jgi:hypothetical protein
MPVLLELFSGTGSMGTAFRQLGWEVISVDTDINVVASLHIDVRLLTPEMVGNIDLIWASPVCTDFSRARTTAKTPRDLVWADSLVMAVIDLASQLRCPALFENPESGLLRHREVVAGIPYRVVDYRKYADDRFTHTARKRTAIWCIDVDWKPERPLCKHDCGFCTGGRHDETAQRGPGRPGQRRHTLQELYAIPPLLCEEIAAWASDIFGA